MWINHTDDCVVSRHSPTLKLFADGISIIWSVGISSPSTDTLPRAKESSSSALVNGTNSESLKIANNKPQTTATSTNHARRQTSRIATERKYQ
jgi:hypothetical protein